MPAPHNKIRLLQCTRWRYAYHRAGYSASRIAWPSLYPQTASGQKKTFTTALKLLTCHWWANKRWLWKVNHSFHLGKSNRYSRSIFILTANDLLLKVASHIQIRDWKLANSLNIEDRRSKIGFYFTWPKTTADIIPSIYVKGHFNSICRMSCTFRMLTV